MHVAEGCCLVGHARVCGTGTGTGAERADVRNRSGRRAAHHVQDLEESMLAARSPASAEHAENAGH